MTSKAIVPLLIVALAGSSISLGAKSKEPATGCLSIQWQRLLDQKGETCERCSGTEKELRKAVTMLKRALRPLGMEVTLEKDAFGVEKAKNILDSNRIVIGGKTLEEWLNAKTGSSACGSCCAKLGETVECRTTTVDGTTYEVIPAELIVKAGLKAAAEVMKAPVQSTSCSKDRVPCAQGKTCCPKAGS